MQIEEVIHNFGEVVEVTLYKLKQLTVLKKKNS